MDSGGAAMVVHGGKVFSGGMHGAVNETFLLEVRNQEPTWRKTELINDNMRPKTRWGHSAVYIPNIPDTFAWRQVRDQNLKTGLLVFGGDCGAAMSDDLMFLDVITETWLLLEVASDQPPARHNHTACKHGQHMYVFGGRNNEGFLRDLWALDLASLAWQQIQLRGSIPAARTGHTAVMHHDKMMVFGGFQQNHQMRTFFADLHEYSTCTQEWAVVNPLSYPLDPLTDTCSTPCMQPNQVRVRPKDEQPPAVQKCCMRPSPRTMSCSVLYENRMYVFGGRDQWTTLGDVACLVLHTTTPRLMDLVMDWIADHHLTSISENLRFTIMCRINQCVQSKCVLCTSSADDAKNP
mmetsp:Transcript_143542/g.250538  ORF Transcript_143542/g.250538 Transcript_143542/m.250538 type:complete len:350 (-) Transcript_143542:91-1140(-)